MGDWLRKARDEKDGPSRNLARQTRRLAGIRTPEEELNLQTIRQLLEQAGNLPAADPLLEQAALDAATGQARDIARQRAAAPGTLGASGSVAQEVLLREALGRGLLSEEAQVYRRQIQRFQAQSQIAQSLQQTAGQTGAIRGSITESLISARSAMQIAKLQAETAKVMQTRQLVAGAVGGLIQGAATMGGAALLAPATAATTAGAAGVTTIGSAPSPSLIGRSAAPVINLGTGAFTQAPVAPYQPLRPEDFGIYSPYLTY